MKYLLYDSLLWFFLSRVCSYVSIVILLFHTDGRLYVATPVDPVFVLLPIFYEARMKVLLTSIVCNVSIEISNINHVFLFFYI